MLDLLNNFFTFYTVEHDSISEAVIPEQPCLYEFLQVGSADICIVLDVETAIS